MHIPIYNIVNKDQPHRNSIQYCVITYMGKKSEKEWIYVYITESLGCTPETNKTL